MGFFNSIKKGIKKAADTTTSTVNTVVNTTTSTVNTVVDTATDTVKVVAKTTTDVANTVATTAEDTANTIAKTAEDTANTVAKTSEDIANETVSTASRATVIATKGAMETANVANDALTHIEAGSVLAMQGIEEGADAVADAGVLIEEWAEENYCQIGVSIALGTIFAALLYRPEPSSQATTTAATAPLSSTAVVYLSARETIGAVALGTACDLTAQAFVELIWIASPIRNAVGDKNKQLLTDAIAFTLCKSIDKAAGAMIIPQSCAAVVAGIVTTLVAQLACERTLPSGARQWATTGASGI